jgi:hypothetical protein
MTLSEIVVLAILITGWLAALLAYRRAWKGGETLAKVERIWRNVWPYSEAALQGWLRAQLAIYIGGSFLLLGYAATVLRPSADASARPNLSMILLIGLIGLVTMFAIAVSIVLFNTPKRLVFPALRDQEGLLVRWWRQRRGRTPKR